MIKVVNKNIKPYEDGYAGVKYTFPVNASVLIPEAAAVHIFGYGLKDKTRQYVRMGLNQLKMRKFLDNFELSPNNADKE